MAIDSLVRPLLRVRLFQGLKPLQISEIAHRAERIVYQPGDVLIAENTVGDSAILIVSGDAVRVSGPPHTNPSENIPVGSLIGEMAMLIETGHTSTVVAKTHVRALRITRFGLHAQMAADPDLADFFVQKIANRLNRIRDELLRIDETLANSSQRLQNYSVAHERDLIVAAPFVH